MRVRGFPFPSSSNLQYNFGRRSKNMMWICNGVSFWFLNELSTVFLHILLNWIRLMWAGFLHCLLFIICSINLQFFVKGLQSFQTFMRSDDILSWLKAHLHARMGSSIVEMQGTFHFYCFLQGWTTIYVVSYFSTTASLHFVTFNPFRILVSITVLIL